MTPSEARGEIVHLEGRADWYDLFPRDVLMSATKVSFDKLRSALGEPRAPREGTIVNEDQVKAMTAADGLLQWADGEGASASAPAAPLLDASHVERAHLWVVRREDVVHAAERCEFGKTLESGVIKHTNLTGGDAAYSGGELVFLDATTVVVNGCSGRYGPRTRAELELAVHAFAESGYGVWSMGFDEEADRPAPFIGVRPAWVS